MLAGGKSARFGSDKALALFRGVPLATHVLSAALREHSAVALVAKDPGRYARLAPSGVALVEDGTALSTPLAGLCAGLSWSPLEVVFACAVDMPFSAHPALLDALFAALPGHDAVVPSCRGQPQPLCALWRRGPALEAALPLLARGAGPLALSRELRAAEVAFEDELPFLDADTPEELARLAGLGWPF